MKNGIIKKALAVILSSTVMVTTLPHENSATVLAAKKNVGLNTTFKTLKIGQSYKLKLKNNAINWKIKKVTTSNKKICTVYNKKTASVLLKGKSEGRATIKIKIITNKRKVYNKKTLKCRVKVISAKSTQVPVPDQPPVSEPESTYNIVFNTNGGNLISGQIVTSGNKITKPVDPTKSGYIFKGWYSDINLQNAYDFTSTVTGNMTLYAKWNNTYKVEFQTNGGNKIEDQIIENGGIVSKPADPVRARSTFIGWFSDSQLKEPYDFSSAVTKDITIYARWKGGYEYPPNLGYTGGNNTSNDTENDHVTTVKYTVKFDSNGGSLVSDQTVKNNEYVIEPTNPTKEGYIFDGWYLDKELTIAYDFKTATNKDLTLYAKWNAILQQKYIIKFNTNGGSTINDQIIENLNTAIKPNDPTKEGYIFDGWYIDEDFNIKFDFSEVISNNITLYAKWKEKIELKTTYYPPVTNLDEDDPDIEIYKAEVNVNSIPVNKTESVMFNAEIFTNIELNENDVCVIDSNSNIIGYMYDDGTNGDVTADDGIFTLQTTLFGSKEEYVEYYVAARNVISYSMGIGYYEPLTDKEIESIKLVDERIENLFSDTEYLASTDEEKKAHVITLLNLLASEKLIIQESINYDDTEELYAFQYQCGVEGGISFKEYDDEFNTGMKESDNELDDEKDVNNFTNPNNNTNKRDIVSANDKNYNLIVLNGFENTIYRRNYYNNLKSDWDNINLNTTVDVDVTVSDLKQLKNYDVIVFSMHGNKYPQNDTKVPVLCINENITETTDTKYSYELNTRKSIKKVFCTDGRYYYWIMPSFFIDSYGKKDLEGKLIFSESCMFYGCDCQNKEPDHTMAQALTGRSVEVVVGYHNSVGADYSRDIMKKTIEDSFNGSKIQESLNAAKNIYGSDDNMEDIPEDKYKAYPIIEGNSNFVLRSNSTLAGNVLDASNSNPIQNALVRLYKDGKEVSKVRTGIHGDYKILHLEPGTYIAKISAGNYKSVRIDVKINENQTSYVETALLVKIAGLNLGFANGIISNSITSEGLFDVKIQMRKNWNNKNGSVVFDTVTNENGYYSIEYLPGFYTLELSKDGFITTYKNIIIGIIDFSEQNANISPNIVDGFYRIVLTWGENPRDLDSHVVGQSSDGDLFHVYFGDKSKFEGDTEICNLDVDDVTSYGPETITLKTTNSQPYYYYIHHYSGIESIATSNAQVKVYKGNENIATFNAPTDQGTDKYWNVFAIKNGELKINNSITSSPNITYAGTNDTGSDEINSDSKQNVLTKDIAEFINEELINIEEKESNE